MKKTLPFTIVIFSFYAQGDVWKKPVYTPDENHLPQEQEEQQIIQDRPQDKKHQEIKKPHDQIEKDETLKDLKEENNDLSEE